MASHSFRHRACDQCTDYALAPPSSLSFSVYISGSTLARHLPCNSLHSTQRITPPLALAAAQRLQRMGLCFLQRGGFCNSWCVILLLHRIFLMAVRPALGQSTMSTRTLISFAVNALIIFSTIHAQDFRDEVGDKLMGRQTIPIVWPKGSRIWILAMLTAWSVGLSWAFNLSIPFSVPFCCLSLFVGLRFFQKRTARADRRSYLYYNVRYLFDCKLSFIKPMSSFADMACGCPSRSYFVPVTETVLSLLQSFI